MKKTTNTTEEKTTTTKTSLLNPFPFIENEKYLLKTTSGIYVITRWYCGKFYSDYNDDFIEEEIASIVALKDLGL